MLVPALSKFLSIWNECRWCEDWLSNCGYFGDRSDFYNRLPPYKIPCPLRDVTPTSAALFRVHRQVLLRPGPVVMPVFFIFSLSLSFSSTSAGHHWAAKAEPCWIQALRLREQRQTPSDSHEHLQVQWRSGETTSGQSGILVAPQPRGARLGDAAAADAAQLGPGGRGVQGQRRWGPQQGIQREPGARGQRAEQREGAAEEEQGHWLQARPPEGFVWEAQEAQRLRAHLRDVWHRGYGDGDGVVVGRLH